jgi:hypothetical protein
MINDAATRERIEDLRFAVKRAREEAQKMSIRLLAASLLPLSRACAELKARHAALVHIANEAEAEIERLDDGAPPISRRRTDPGMHTGDQPTCDQSRTA